jgi:hypothetical protein
MGLAINCHPWDRGLCSTSRRADASPLDDLAVQDRRLAMIV